MSFPFRIFLFIYNHFFILDMHFFVLVLKYLSSFLLHYDMLNNHIISCGDSLQFGFLDFLFNWRITLDAQLDSLKYMLRPFLKMILLSTKTIQN